ncbi:unnamed protein product [Rotaria sp. Silwood2]|nr:unnamed protein product [Rotaria sp. Silwood2]CAF4535853.1 unnamed protein product [Rotaria sp. Silwood2]
MFMFSDCDNDYGDGSDELVSCGTIVSYVYYKNKYYVSAISLDERNELTFAHDFMELSSIEYDWKDKTLYIGDRLTDKIHRMNFNKTQSIVIVEDNQISSIRTLAINWFKWKLYQLIIISEIRISELDGRYTIT